MKNPEEGPLVFVCYSHHDREFAAEVVKQLQAVLSFYEKEIFVDEADIEVGEVWLDRVVPAIRSAKAAVFLVSADSLTSEPIKIELEYMCSASSSISLSALSC